MRTGQTLCDHCRREIVHPSMLAVSMTVRANTGHGKEEPDEPEGSWKRYGIMGFVEVEIKGDFCDEQCLKSYALERANVKIGLDGVHKVRQDIFSRGNTEEGIWPKYHKEPSR